MMFFLKALKMMSAIGARVRDPFCSDCSEGDGDGYPFPNLLRTVYV